MSLGEGTFTKGRPVENELESDQGADGRGGSVCTAGIFEMFVGVLK